MATTAAVPVAGVQVEGNLLIDHEEDSSDEEESREEEDGDEPLQYENDDSDEELEVFQYEQTVTPQKEEEVITLLPVQKKTNEAPKSLISAMEESVRDLEEENSSKITRAVEGPRSLISMMERSVSEVEAEKVPPPPSSLQSPVPQAKAKAARKQARDGEITPTTPKSKEAAFADFTPTSENSKPKSSNGVPPADPHLTGGADAFGIVYRPYGKQKKEYNVPSGPAFEDEAEFERDLMSSHVLKLQPQSQINDDDEFDFDVSDTKTFAESAQQQPSPASAMSNLKLTTLGGKQGPDVELDGEDSDEDSSSAIQEEPQPVESEQISVEPATPLSTRDAAKLALAEITGIYSSGLGDHEVTIMKSSTSTETTTQELSLLAKLGIKDSAIEEIDEEELERAEEREIEQEREFQLQQEFQKNELESQWEAVESIQQSQINLNVGEEISADINYPLLSYRDVLTIFRNMDLSEYRSSVVIDDQPGTWNPLRGDTSLSKANIPRSDIEFPFLVAQVDYNPELYLPILRTLYKKLAVDQGSRHPRCPTTGPHWEPLGFQGNDPRTDLNRSMKMLSVLQILHMLETEKGMTNRLFLNSLGSGTVIASPSTANGNVRDLDDSWPFMLVGISMTKYAIDALRSGALTKEVNKVKSVLDIAHEFHHACFYCYLRALIEHPLTHHAVHLSNLRKDVQTNPLSILKAFRNSKTPKTLEKSSSTDGNDREVKYDNLDDEGHHGKKEKKSWSLPFGNSSKEKKFLAKNQKNDEES